MSDNRCGASDSNKFTAYYVHIGTQHFPMYYRISISSGFMQEQIFRELYGAEMVLAISCIGDNFFN